MKKVLLLPGWMRGIDLYHAGDLEIRIGKLDEYAASADCLIGISLSTLVILRDMHKIKGKVILVNPLLPSQSLVRWIIALWKLITNEGLFLERQKFSRNPFKYVATSIDAMQLVHKDFSETLEKISENKLVVIRGKGDHFFCDAKSADFLRAQNIQLIEVDGGHSWSEAAERAVGNYMKDCGKA